MADKIHYFITVIPEGEIKRYESDLKYSTPVLVFLIEENTENIRLFSL